MGVHGVCNGVRCLLLQLRLVDLGRETYYIVSIDKDGNRSKHLVRRRTHVWFVTVRTRVYARACQQAVRAYINKARNAHGY